jgi:hypothetical protein
LSRQIANPLLEAIIAGLLGHAHTLAGRVAEGLPLLEQAAERVQRAGRPMEAQVRLHLAEAYVTAGRLDDAAASIEATLTVVRQRRERAMEAHALKRRGGITRQRHPEAFGAARADLRDALALATQHLFANHSADVDGDRAVDTRYMQARHQTGAEHYTIGGYYAGNMVRTPAGWRIARYQLTVTFSDGDHRLMGIAYRKTKGGA